MPKGRATATFKVASSIVNGVLEVVITADATVGDDIGHIPTQTVNGTVALGQAVAELGKQATPITSADRKFAETVENNIAAGLTLEQATSLATVNAAV